MNKGFSNRSERDEPSEWYFKLTAAGVAPEVAADVSSAWKLRSQRWLVGISLSAPFYGALLWMLLSGFNQLEAFEERNALAFALKYDGLLFEAVTGPSALVGVFAFLITFAWLAWSLPIILGEPFKSISALCILNDFEQSRLATKRFKSVVAGQTPNESAAEFLSRLAHIYSNSYRSWAVPLLALTVCLCILEMRVFTLVKSEGMLLNPWAFWKGPQSYDFSEIDHVELGCNHTKDGGYVEYKVKFQDGAQFNLAQFHPVSGSWIETIRPIDQQITAASVPFLRSKFWDRDPMHPKCLEVQGKLLAPNNQAALLDLLRASDDLEQAP